MSPSEFALRGWRKLRAAARSVIGVPDYEAYVRHVRQHHTDREPMSYAEFFADVAVHGCDLSEELRRQYAAKAVEQWSLEAVMPRWWELLQR